VHVAPDPPGQGLAPDVTAVGEGGERGGDQVVDEGRIARGLGVGHRGYEELGVRSVVQLAGLDQAPQLGERGQIALGPAVEDHRSRDPLDRIPDRFSVPSEFAQLLVGHGHRPSCWSLRPALLTAFTEGTTEP
jgi:hypothetical protein